MAFENSDLNAGYSALMRQNQFADRAGMADPAMYNSAGQSTSGGGYDGTGGGIPGYLERGNGIPGPADIAVSPRSRMVGAQGGIPAAPQPPQPYLPGQNAKQLLDARTALNQYKLGAFNKAYNDAQRQILGTAPIPGVSGPMRPTNAPGTPPSSSPPPSPPSQIPGVSTPYPTPGALSFPSRQSIGSASPLSSPNASTIPAVGGSITMTDANGKITSATGAQLTPPSPQIGDMATLRGQFPNHDAQGNVIPGSYRTVDASAPRDAANIAAIAKDNYRSSPEFHQVLTDDPGYKTAQQKVADVQAATAAHQPLSVYQQHQALLAGGQPAQDLAALSPKDRLAYQQKQADDKARNDLEQRKADLIRNKQIADNLGGFGKFVIGGLKQVNDWFKTTGQQSATNAKTAEQKAQADREFRLHAETAWQSIQSRIIKSFNDKNFDPDNPTPSQAAALAKARDEFQKHVYGDQAAANPQTPVTTQPATDDPVSILSKQFPTATEGATKYDNRGGVYTFRGGKWTVAK